MFGKKSEAFPLFIICASVTLFGAVVVHSYSKPPENIMKVVEVTRSPSSSKTTLRLEKVAPKVKNFSLPCDVKSQLKISASQVRFAGPTCKKESELIGVKNLTNGHLATVFETQPGHFTTDFIQIKKGKNDLVFSIRASNGKTETHSVIINGL